MKTKKLKENFDFNSEELLDLDFNAFDKVVTVVATKEDQKVVDFDDPEFGVEVDLDDIEEDDFLSGPVGVFSNSEIPQEEGVLKLPAEEEIPETPTDVEEEDAEEAIEVIEEELQVVSPFKSLAEVYNIRKNFKTNKLVESILSDSVVDNMYNILVSTLRSNGISNAQAIVTIGLLLDRMLKADDGQVSDPNFMKEIIGELVDNKDIEKVVHDAVQAALVYRPEQKPINVDATEVNIQVSGKDKERLETITESECTNPEEKEIPDEEEEKVK